MGCGPARSTDKHVCGRRSCTSPMPSAQSSSHLHTWRRCYCYARLTKVPHACDGVSYGAVCQRIPFWCWQPSVLRIHLFNCRHTPWRLATVSFRLFANLVPVFNRKRCNHMHDTVKIIRRTRTSTAKHSGSMAYAHELWLDRDRTQAHQRLTSVTRCPK